MNNDKQIENVSKILATATTAVFAWELHMLNEFLKDHPEYGVLDDYIPTSFNITNLNRGFSILIESKAVKPDFKLVNTGIDVDLVSPEARYTRNDNNGEHAIITDAFDPRQCLCISAGHEHPGTLQHVDAEPKILKSLAFNKEWHEGISVEEIKQLNDDADHLLEDYEDWRSDKYLKQPPSPEKDQLRDRIRSFRSFVYIAAFYLQDFFAMKDTNILETVSENGMGVVVELVKQGRIDDIFKEAINSIGDLMAQRNGFARLP